MGNERFSHIQRDPGSNDPVRPTSYLGDGVYAEHHKNTEMILLYTHNGIERQSEIWIDIQVFAALKRFGDRAFPAVAKE